MYGRFACDRRLTFATCLVKFGGELNEAIHVFIDDKGLILVCSAMAPVFVVPHQVVLHIQSKWRTRVWHGKFLASLRRRLEKDLENRLLKDRCAIHPRQGGLAIRIHINEGLTHLNEV